MENPPVKNIKIILFSFFIIILGVFRWIILAGWLRFNYILFDRGAVRWTSSINNIILIFLLSVIVITLIVTIWSRFYMHGRFSLVFFLTVLLLFVISMIFLLIRSDFFSVFLGWEGLGVTSFLLIIYYQNWIRRRGGILTLLTNRLGDGLLILRFAYWIIFCSPFLLKRRAAIGFLFFFLTRLTKRAQLPFTSWLPAAIAAPTPVRALVHSSTLVTAGVWLLIRFRQFFNRLVFLIMVLGTSTIILASLAALFEVDGKKVVALSTLRQLGLIFVSLSLGNWLVCLFHLLMHAFAKANLFLIVGNLLHIRFSQQDSRQLSSGLMETRIIFIFLVRIFRLRGIIFFSGFYSKDRIFFREYRLVTRILGFSILVRAISLTLTYCLKLIFSFCEKQICIPLNEGIKDFIKIRPRLTLTLIRVILGFLFIDNFNWMLMSKSSSSLNWIFLIFRLRVFGLLIFINPPIWRILFYSQVFLVNSLRKKTSLFFKKISRFTSSFHEGSYLITFLTPKRSLISQLLRGRVIIFCVSFIVMYF